MNNLQYLTSSSSIPARLFVGADDERELIEALRRRDERAYESLVREYGSAMLTTARRYLPRGDDSEDAVQDALVSAFRCIESFNCESRLATWLHRIVVNACLMKLRAQGRSARLTVNEDLSQFDSSSRHHRQMTERDPVHAGVALDELKGHVRQCIEQLPPSYREVLILRDLKELDTLETAQALNTTPANVKTRLHRARQVLRTLLAPAFVATESLQACA
jgi:RNA polymerase sigma-70 factor (ECF subfamily)